jgi:hypothetical protein
MKHSSRPVIRCLALAALAFPATLPAQYITRTWLDWRTIETPHFAVHYPTELEPWARIVAGKVERIDSTVSGIVGYTPRARIDVVIDDPYSISNGSAWPFLDAPALVFWATPPDPREDVGTYVSWADMLASHEFAHLAHLTRPSRNAFQSLLWRLAPVDLGPIPQKVPRWLFEGYATYVEGIVTGSGRPHGTWRSTYLRQWALEGRLPPYSQLDTYGGMYGGEFAYLAGSAFLEWLARRNGDSSLVSLWRRLTAKVDRSFDDAFTGVYGEPPALLYGRFAAELTAQAKATQLMVVRASPDSGRPIAHLIGETGDPAISTDGGKVALMLPSPGRPARVVIWKTIAEPDSAAARSARELLRRDPQDVAPIRPFPAPKKALAALPAVGNQPYQGPRFLRDGRLLVWRNAAVGDGSFRPDLFLWDPQRGLVSRITRGANVREGDPTPDGRLAVALRCGGGTCDLVTVDLRTAEVRTVAPGSETRSFYRPRVSSDGRRVLSAVHDSGFWRIAVTDLADGAVHFVRPPDGANWFDASFADDSTIVATTDGPGIPTIVRFSVLGGDAVPLTHVSGAAIAAEVNPADHTVWFLALHSRGWDLRAVPLEPTSVAAVTSSATAHAEPTLIPASPIAPPTRYRGRRQTIWIPGGVGGADGMTATLAIVNSDVVGRNELLLQGQSGWDRAWKGGSATLTSRSLRAPVFISAFSLRQDSLAGAPSARVDMTGAAMFVDYSRRYETSATRLTVGGTVARFQPTPGRTATRALGSASLSLAALSLQDGARNSAALALTGNDGVSDSSSVQRLMMSVGLEHTGAVILPIVLNGSAGRVWTSTPFELFSIGGLPATILQPGVLAQRIANPRLPSGMSVGRQVMTYRAGIPFAGVQLYDWGARTADGDGNDSWTRVTGAGWVGSLPAVPTIGTPAGRATIGAAIVPTAPSPHPIRAYFAIQFGDWAR